MTDEELIARLRKRGGRIPTAAADRIERLKLAGKIYREATRHLNPCPGTAAGFDADLKGADHE